MAFRFFERFSLALDSCSVGVGLVRRRGSLNDRCISFGSDIEGTELWESWLQECSVLRHPLSRKRKALCLLQGSAGLRATQAKLGKEDADYKAICNPWSGNITTASSACWPQSSARAGVMGFLLVLQG